MARRRKKKGRRKGRIPAGLRRWMQKHGKLKRAKRARKGNTMAKKKRKSGRRSPRRKGRRSSRRRGRFGGGELGLKPTSNDIKFAGAMAGIGWLEGVAKTQSNADIAGILAKVPKPIAALGWTGNMALVAWLVSYFFKLRWLRLGSRAAAYITAYQLGRQGKAFSSGAEFFSISGYDDDDVREMLDTAMGALSADGGADTDGLTWDEAAENAMQMVG